MLLKGLQTVYCMSQLSSDFLSSRWKYLQRSRENLKEHRLFKIQEQRIKMEMEFEKCFRDLMLKYFFVRKQGWKLNYEDFYNSEISVRNNRSKKFYEVQNIIKHLICNDFIPFCYKYFSIIKYMILREYVPERDFKFFQAKHLAYELTVQFQVKYKDYIETKHFAADKTHDPNFCYLLKRLEQIISDHTKNSIEELRACLYPCFTSNFNVYTAQNTREFYYDFITFFKYSYITDEMLHPTEYVFDNDIMFGMLVSIYEDVLAARNISTKHSDVFEKTGDKDVYCILINTCIRTPSHLVDDHNLIITEKLIRFLVQTYKTFNISGYEKNIVNSNK
ncbi:hypothetical protein CDIK_1626 [Cucumispora dikerogammari]|nr:hypothetical protein CDIK_1626 [Cucumispora dikerogammari]